MSETKNMKVTLIGAGPGDAGLMTIKGMQRLQEADVVLYDRLVGDDILAMIPKSAEKICVGKHANRHPVPQEEIESLMLAKAREGKHVVRLKGGDPFVFGRGGEELELLAEHGIPFEVVPGVSSAIAAGTYSGIPLTHRDYASSLHIITGHARKNGELDIDFDSLARLNGTVVIMMGVATLEKVCRRFLDAGMPETMPAAITENATLASQRKFIGTLGTLVSLAHEHQVVSPSVVILGKVCLLAEKLDWFAGTLCKERNSHKVAKQTKNAKNDILIFSRKTETMKGILVVAHGSRIRETEDTLLFLLDIVRRNLPDYCIEHAFMEFSEQTLEKGIAALIARNVSEIKVVPYFLFSGVHLREDIPAIIRECMSRYPEIPVTMGDTLGADPRLAEILIDRIIR